MYRLIKITDESKPQFGMSPIEELRVALEELAAEIIDRIEIDSGCGFNYVIDNEGPLGYVAALGRED